MNYEEVTAGSFDAITLADARLQVKEPSNVTVEDDLIKSYIKRATKTVEHKTNRVVSSRTWAGWLDSWPTDYIIRINKSPVTEITSIQYYDSSNVLQTLSSSLYSTDIVSKVARIYLEELPDLYKRVNAVKVNFTAGYSTIENVDERIKQYVRLIVADHKQVRTDYVTGTIVSHTPRRAEELLHELKYYEV